MGRGSDRFISGAIIRRADIISEDISVSRQPGRRRRSGKLRSLVWVAGLSMAVCLGPSSLSQTAEAAGPSLQERRHQRDQEKRLASEAEFTSKICGTKITASIHWGSFNTRGVGTNVVGYCDVALSAIERICRENKSKVQGSVRHLQCGAGDKRAVSLSGSTVRYAVGPRPSRDDHEFVYKFLKRKL